MLVGRRVDGRMFCYGKFGKGRNIRGADNIRGTTVIGLQSESNEENSDACESGLGFRGFD